MHSAARGGDSVFWWKIYAHWNKSLENLCAVLASSQEMKYAHREGMAEQSPQDPPTDVQFINKVIQKTELTYSRVKGWSLWSSHIEEKERVKEHISLLHCRFLESLSHTQSPSHFGDSTDLFVRMVNWWMRPGCTISSSSSLTFTEHFNQWYGGPAFINFAQRLLGYGRRRRVGAMCPSRKEGWICQPQLERPLNWDRPCCDAVMQLAFKCILWRMQTLNWDTANASLFTILTLYLTCCLHLKFCAVQEVAEVRWILNTSKFNVKQLIIVLIN